MIAVLKAVDFQFFDLIDTFSEALAAVYVIDQFDRDECITEILEVSNDVGSNNYRRSASVKVIGKI